MPISVNCKLLLYADDSALLVDGKNPTDIAARLSLELALCRQWLINNKLSLHLGKTESILFFSKRKLNQPYDFKVMCNNEPIKSAESVKYLGITLDRTLSGQSIVQNVIKKAGSRLRFLYRQSHLLDLSVRKTLVTALIQCHFDYSSSSWYSGLPKVLKNQLQIMQNKMVRFCLNLDSRAHVGQEELDTLGFLYVNDRVDQLKLNHAFKIFNGLSPDYLSDNFIKVADRHIHNTRDSHLNFAVPRVKGQCINTFNFSSVKVWNSLPGHIKSINSYSNFKKEVKAHLALESKLREGGVSFH